MRAAVVKVALKSTKIVHLVPQLLHTVRRASRGIRIGDFILFLFVLFLSLFLDAVRLLSLSLSILPLPRIYRVVRIEVYNGLEGL